MVEILFRGGVMDGKRIEVKELSSFIDVPIGPLNGPYGHIRYREAERIGDLVIFELDTAKH